MATRSASGQTRSSEQPSNALERTTRCALLIGVEEQQEAAPAHVLLFGTDDLFDHSPFSHGLGLSSLFGSRHPFSPFGGFFREQALREREEHLRQQRLYEEKVRKAELERRKALVEKIKQAREQKMKQLAEAQRKSQEVSTTAAPKSLVPEFPPGWSVTPFGSWEPVVQAGVPSLHSVDLGTLWLPCYLQQLREG